MSERETTPDITSELNALADQVQQDREAGVFLGKGQQPPIVSELSRQLRASIRYDAINGTATERAICGSQMIRAADRLDHLEAENALLKRLHQAIGDKATALFPNMEKLDAVAALSLIVEEFEVVRERDLEAEQQLTAATSRAEQAERERDEVKRECY